VLILAVFRPKSQSLIPSQGSDDLARELLLEMRDLELEAPRILGQLLTSPRCMGL
jgi:hypothetical protein